MTPLEQVLFPNNFGMELIYSFVIIFCSLAIYYSTKKMYEISRHTGIKYFREAFLFFAIAYFFKSFIDFLLLILGFHEVLEFDSFFLGLITLFIFMYASTMAIFYLFYSVIWKNLKDKKFITPVVHVIVITISAVSILTQYVALLLLLQICIFILITVYNYILNKKSKSKKKVGPLYTVYFSLFAFWILNLIDLLIEGFDPILELVISMVSIGIFLVISYKVMRSMGPD